ncbi:hypothetical protein MHBO_003804, partial [Bonamia ostreae]
MSPYLGIDDTPTVLDPGPREDDGEELPDYEDESTDSESTEREGAEHRCASSADDESNDYTKQDRRFPDLEIYLKGLGSNYDRELDRNDWGYYEGGHYYSYPSDDESNNTMDEAFEFPRHDPRSKIQDSRPDRTSPSARLVEAYESPIRTPPRSQIGETPESPNRDQSSPRTQLSSSSSDDSLSNGGGGTDIDDGDQHLRESPEPSPNRCCDDEDVDHMEFSYHEDEQSMDFSDEDGPMGNMTNMLSEFIKRVNHCSDEDKRFYNNSDAESIIIDDSDNNEFEFTEKRVEDAVLDGVEDDRIKRVSRRVDRRKITNVPIDEFLRCDTSDP